MRVDSQSRCVEVDLTSIGRLRSSASCDPTRSSSPLRRILFSTPLFSRFPHGSPCYPRHPSAWFNYSWNSSSVLCRSAAVMFDAAKKAHQVSTRSHQQHMLCLVPQSRKTIISQLSSSLLKQSDTVLTSRITNSFLPLTAGLAWAGHPENSPLSLIDGIILL